MKKLFIASAGVAAVAAVAVAGLGASPAPPLPALLPTTAAPIVGVLSASPAVVGTSTPTPVVVTISITDPTLLAGGVNLLQVDPTGRTISTVGVMHDDGLNGDATASDKVFSYRVTLNQPAVGQVYYRASAAFKGILVRVQSASVTVQVWRSSATAMGLTVSQPPGWSITPRLPREDPGGAEGVVIIDPARAEFDESISIFVQRQTTVAAATGSLSISNLVSSSSTVTSSGTWSVLVYLDGGGLHKLIVAFLQLGPDVVTVASAYSEKNSSVLSQLLPLIH